MEFLLYFRYIELPLFFNTQTFKLYCAFLKFKNACNYARSFKYLEKFFSNHCERLEIKKTSQLYYILVKFFVSKNVMQHCLLWEHVPLIGTFGSFFFFFMIIKDKLPKILRIKIFKIRYTRKLSHHIIHSYIFLKIKYLFNKSSNLSKYIYMKSVAFEGITHIAFSSQRHLKTHFVKNF